MTDANRSRFRPIGRGALGVGLALLLLGPTVALAQDDGAARDVPTAEECEVEPVEITTLLTTTSGADASSPLFSAVPVDEASLPDGPEVTEEELAGITDTVRQLVACANALDPFRIMALVSEQYIGQLVNAALAAQEQPELAEQLLVRFPVPLAAVEGGEPVAMIPIRDGRLLADGRVGAILEAQLATGTRDGITALFYVAFVEVEDRWLVDEVQPVSSELFGTPPATPATPVASR